MHSLDGEQGSPSPYKWLQHDLLAFDDSFGLIVLAVSLIPKIMIIDTEFFIFNSGKILSAKRLL